MRHTWKPLVLFATTLVPYYLPALARGKTQVRSSTYLPCVVGYGTRQMPGQVELRADQMRLCDDYLNDERGREGMRCRRGNSLDALHVHLLHARRRHACNLLLAPFPLGTPDLWVIRNHPSSVFVLNQQQRLSLTKSDDIGFPLETLDPPIWVYHEAERKLRL